LVSQSLLSLSPLYLAHLLLRSFPTRRSSDLARRGAGRDLFLHLRGEFLLDPALPLQPHPRGAARVRDGGHRRPRGPPTAGDRGRSEEHTSELQSRFDLVCRLLLEKKKGLVRS